MTPSLREGSAPLALRWLPVGTAREAKASTLAAASRRHHLTGNRAEHRMPWKPGESGNPAGRPAMPEEVKEAIQRIGPMAVRRMEEMLQTRRFARLDSKSQIKLLEVAIARAYGRPVDAEPKQLEISGAVEHHHLSVKELVGRISNLPEFKNARSAARPLIDSEAEDAEEATNGTED